MGAEVGLRRLLFDVPGVWKHRWPVVITFPLVPLPIPEPRASGMTTLTKVPLYWARYGQDPEVEPARPTIIVLHGGPGADHRYLLPQMLELARHYDLLFYDQRGGGKSRTSDNSPVAWRDHVADLGDICREFGIKKPSLLGYSWGAILALLYASEAMEDADLAVPARLVLLSPGPVTMEYRATFNENMKRRGSTPELMAERQALADSGLRDSDPDTYRQRLFELGVAAYFADTADAVNLTPFRVVGRVQDSVWESLGDYDLLPRAERIKIPSSVIHGVEDPIPVDSARDLASALGAESVFIDGSGHVPYVEKPAELWVAINSFLEATDSIVQS